MNIKATPPPNLNSMLAATADVKIDGTIQEAADYHAKLLMNPIENLASRARIGKLRTPTDRATTDMIKTVMNGSGVLIENRTNGTFLLTLRRRVLDWPAMKAGAGDVRAEMFAERVVANMQAQIKEIFQLSHAPVIRAILDQPRFSLEIVRQESLT